MSTPVQWLVGASRGEHQARDAFSRWIGAHPAQHRLDARWREDVVQDVVVHFLARAPEVAASLTATNPVIGALLQGARADPDALAAANRRLDAYVGRSILNRMRSLGRRSRWEQAEALVEELPDPRVGGPGDPAELALRALERVEQHVVDAAGPADTRQDLEQVKALALGGVAMGELVEAEAEGASDPEGRIRARNRLYTRHRRVRVALRGAVDALEASGALRAEEAEAARIVIEYVLKRRQTGGG